MGCCQSKHETEKTVCPDCGHETDKNCGCQQDECNCECNKDEAHEDKDCCCKG